MIDVESKSNLGDYAEVLRKIRCIKLKDEDVDIVAYSQDIERFVTNYLNGRLLFEIPSSELSDAIDYDIDFVSKNLGKDWKDEVLCLQNMLKRRLKKEVGGFSFLSLLKKLLGFVLVLLLAVFFLKFALRYNTSFNIMTNKGLESAAKIHFKSTWYDYWRRKYDNVPAIVIDSVLWPLKLTNEEDKYYGEYIALNIEIANMLKKKRSVCCDFCSFDINEDFDEEKADKFIRFIDVPSLKIVEKARKEDITQPKLAYYKIIVESYKEKFPCTKK